MEVRLEFFSKHSCLLGFDYKTGTGNTAKGKKVFFHELGFGLVFGAFYITWY